MLRRSLAILDPANIFLEAIATQESGPLAYLVGNRLIDSVVSQFDFSVVYESANTVLHSSITQNNIEIKSINPNTLATTTYNSSNGISLISTIPGSSANRIVATYRFTRNFTSADNRFLWEVFVKDLEVSDISGNFAADKKIGILLVDIS